MIISSLREIHKSKLFAKFWNDRRPNPLEHNVKRNNINKIHSRLILA